MNKKFGNASARAMMGSNLPDRLSDIEKKLKQRNGKHITELMNILRDLVGPRIIATDDPDNTEPQDSAFSGWVMAATAQALADGNFTLARILVGLVQYGIGDDGLLIRGADFLERHLATIGSYNRLARRGFRDLLGKPAYVTEVEDADVGTNLITSNPGFESGNVSTGYSTNTNWSVDSTKVNSGAYSATTSNTNPLTTNKYAVTAGNMLRVGAYLRVLNDTVSITVKFYDAVPAQVGPTITIFSENVATSPNFTEKYGFATAPAGATQAEVIVTYGGGSGMHVDDLSLVVVTQLGGTRISDDGVDIFDEIDYVRYHDGALEFPFLDGAVVENRDGGIIQFLSSDSKPRSNYGSELFNIAGAGWTPYAYPVGYYAGQTTGGTLTLAAGGGCVAAPVLLTAPMRLYSVSLRVNDIGARTWNWALFEEGHETDNVLTRVHYGQTPDSFTAGGAETRTVDLGSLQYISAGIYWLVIQNTHASNALIIQRSATDIFSLNMAQTKTVTNPVGSTLDFTAATWTKIGNVPLIRLNGYNFGNGAF